MDDYKEMYYHLAHEVEQARRILEEAQKTCEDLYLSQENAESAEK